MAIKRVGTNECEIRITPRSAGNFGFMIIGGESRSAHQEYRLCEEIVENIKRHVDDIGYTYIEQKTSFETDDGGKFESLFEALEHLYDEEGCGTMFEYSYKRPNDKYGTRSRTNSFERLIEEAYNNPWDFEIHKGNSTHEQALFLWKVVEASLHEKMPKAIAPTESTQAKPEAEPGVTGGTHD